MRRKTYLFAVLALVLAVALIGGLSAARAQGDADLPDLSAQELIAAVAENAPATTTVSGDFTWTNDLLGTGSLPLAGGSEFSAFLQSGSGRVWFADGKARLEAQGRHGDTAAVYDGDTLWVYSSANDTATEYELPDHATGGAQTQAAAGDATGAKPEFDMVAEIDGLVAELAPDATLSVTETTVAGRASYVLSLTPTATNTVFGAVDVAFDGETFLPLRLQVRARGDADPVLEAGFTSVSYDAVPDDVFAFTPPAGTKVETKTLSMPGDLGGTGKELALPGSLGADEGSDGAAGSDASHDPLTLAEAEAEAGFSLLTPSDQTLPFASAYVMTPPEAASPSPDSTPARTLPQPNGPVVALTYGQGLGSVLVVEMPVADTQMAELTAQLGSVPVIGTPVAMGDREVYQLQTRLGSAVMWEENGLLIIVAGSVPQGDLATFASSIR